MVKQIVMAWFLTMGSIGLFAQSYKITSTEDSILWYADIMHNAEVDVHRLYAAYNFSELIKSYLDKDSEFELNVPPAPGTRIIYAPDSVFRILTWQTIDSLDRGEFSGLFQLKGDSSFQLTDVSAHVGTPPRAKYRGGKWIGIVYTDIVQYGATIDSTYVLIGSGVEDKRIWKHIAESLKIIDGKPVFGAEAFSTHQSKKDREVMKFSAGSGASMHYLPAKSMLVFDELQVVIDPVSGRQSNVPSGFYNAYILKDGKWIYKEEVQP